MKYETMVANIKNYIYKDRKMILASLAIGLSITAAFGFFTKAYSENIQKGIAGQVIRFHVLANSDEIMDQELKLKVRDGILAEYQEELSLSNNIEETRRLLAGNLNEIQAFAAGLIAAEGYDYPVTVHLSMDMFPTKTYGDITLPAGEYEALRVVIGEGAGQNWWCVMFPPLCFVDVTKGEIPEESKEELKELLTEDEYGLIAQEEEDIGIQVKFKIVEWWQERKDPDAFALIETDAME